MNIIQTRENTLPVSRRIQRDLTIHRIEKRHHFWNRFNDMTVAIENRDIVRHFHYLQFGSNQDNKIFITKGKIVRANSPKFPA